MKQSSDVEPILTIAILTMHHSDRLAARASSYTRVAQIEVVIVNQSGVDFNISNVLELKPSVRLSASRARNHAYCHSKSNFILFLDEDAYISVDHLDALCGILRKKTSNSRMFLLGGKYISRSSICREYFLAKNIFRYIKFYCEWNCVYNKSQIYGRPFPCIGVGSRNVYWSGEGLLSLLKIKPNTELLFLPDINVDHPPLNAQKPLKTCIKYQFGYGYAMAVIFLDGKYALLRFEALFRFLGSLLLLLIRPTFVPAPSNGDSKLLRLVYSHARVNGFIDRLSGVLRKNEI